MTRQKRQAVTRSKAKNLKFTRLQVANAGTKARKVPGFVLGPENQNVWELEGGVQRPTWLTPNKPKWTRFIGKGIKYGGLAGLVAGSAYDLYQASSQLNNYKKPTPLRGYLDSLYPKKSKETKMAPIRRMRKQQKYATRKRTILRRRYRKRAPLQRRYRRRGPSSRLQRTIRRSTKKVVMRHYKRANMYRKICDVINIGDYFEPPTGTSPPLAKYHNLAFTVADLPRLNEVLVQPGIGGFRKVRIDKVTYKIVVENARQLSMDPNYRAPNGEGVTASEPPVNMAHPEEYAKKNSYVFHRRLENDVLASSSDFGDWSLFECAQKGAITYVSFFRQKGKMFNTAAAYTKTISYSYNGINNSKKIDGVPMGWFDVGTLPTNLQVGNAGLILPGMYTKGWDGETNNPIPRLSVSVRVCSTVMGSKSTIDNF